MLDTAYLNQLVFLEILFALYYNTAILFNKSHCFQIIIGRWNSYSRRIFKTISKDSHDFSIFFPRRCELLSTFSGDRLYSNRHSQIFIYFRNNNSSYILFDQSFDRYKVVFFCYAQIDSD